MTVGTKMHLVNTLPIHMTVLMWASNITLVIATLAMTQPMVAATSPIPWLGYLFANAVWLYDSVRRRLVSWIILAAFLACWDTLVIIKRITGMDAFQYIAPWLEFFNYLL